MKIVFKNITGILLLFVLMCAVSPKLSGQEASQEDAIMQIDAYAMAYGKCKVETAKYQTENNPTNAMLLNSYNKVLLDYKKFSVNLNAKYRTDEAMFEKFSRSINRHG